MSLSARPPVIVVGGNANALSIARALGPAGIDVYGLGVSGAASRSRYLRPLPLPSGSGPEQALAAALLGPETEHLRGAVVLACSDVGITVLARNRDALLERFRLDESDVTAQLDMLDKLTTYEHAVAAGVPTPLFWRVDSPEDLQRHRDEYVYPLIVKPLLSHEYQARFPGRTKFRVVADFDELLTEYRALSDAGLAVLLTEQIPGGDELLCSYYTYIDASGTATFDFTKRVIRRHPPGMGLACYHITDWNPEVRDVALQLFKYVGLRGLANAEFKRDERDGKLKLIECNARFTGGNPLVAAAGLDLAAHVYHRILGEPHELPTSYARGKRMLTPVDDLQSFLALRATGELNAGQWLRSLAHRQIFPYLRWDDPMPAVARATDRVRKLLSRLR
ncbi:carboxylate--amine ligase [Pseudonocardia bannensis]|uniref:ATP-grasp domain-containing protein n=1 Tax=Pseudonocardia bannensis TaxID=630973 RepID=A0A848DEX6_9PSEU|nr:ATP-grasp domain-containing protein [Pseudonocardia bannensis]NMH91157.1 hypothetical protein [Pseudonocardia bannensis]